jgi:hypothetical protein
MSPSNDSSMMEKSEEEISLMMLQIYERKYKQEFKKEVFSSHISLLFTYCGLHVGTLFTFHQRRVTEDRR